MAKGTDDWTAEVAAWLSEQPYGSDELDFVALLQELSTRAFQASHDELDWLRGETSIALGHAGDAIRAVASERWQELVHLTKGKPERGQFQRINARAQRLLSSSSAESWLLAAWADLLRGVEDPSITVATLRWRRDLVARLSGLRGTNWSDTARVASDVLREQAWGVQHARTLLEIDGSDSSMSDPTARAGLEWGMRAELASALFLAPPRPKSHVVWLAFDAANVHIHPQQSFGPVTFYDGPYVRNKLETAPADLPQELASGWIKAGSLPDQENYVLARVDLGSARPYASIAEAATVARAIVYIAKLRAGLLDIEVWKPFEGGILAVDGRVVEEAFFRDAAREKPWDALLLGPAYELEDMAARYPAPDAGALLALAPNLEWLRFTGQGDLDAAVLMSVRILDAFAKELGRKQWFTYLDGHLGWAWVRHSMKSALGRTVRSSIGEVHYMSGRLSEEDNERLREITRRVLHNRPGITPVIHLGEAMNSLQDLIDIHGAHSPHARALREILHHLEGPVNLTAWSRQLRREWATLLRRLRWVRNTIAHGPGPSRPVLESIAPFARQVASWVSDLRIEAALKDEDLEASMTALRLDSVQWAATLKTSSNMYALLVGE